ncbi:hypothetical protein ACFCXS_19320 [Streptomyces sp. NPDC056373]|uniref:hypothetical protein n=1 Tax=Streptomyces sp. NPDC056373 TaxID=3345798 RepID=UPI0035D68380
MPLVVGRWNAMRAGTNVAPAMQAKAAAPMHPMVTTGTSVFGTRSAVPMVVVMSTFLALTTAAAIICRQQGRAEARVASAGH